MKVIDLLSSIFKRNPKGELEHISNAIDNSLGMVAKDLSLLELEYVIGSSTGEWLEHWGSWFGIPRLLDETDEYYRNRIVATVTKPKCTITALQDTVKAYYDDDSTLVEILEPFVHIAKYNQSAYSGIHKIQDGVYYRYGVIEIWVDEEITPALVQIVYLAKSAGIKVYFGKNTPMDIEGAETMYSHTMENVVESNVSTEYNKPPVCEEKESQLSIHLHHTSKVLTDSHRETQHQTSIGDLDELAEPISILSDGYTFGSNIFDLFMNPNIPLIDIENQSLHDNLPVQEDICNELSLSERAVYYGCVRDMIEPSQLGVPLIDIERKYLYEMHAMYPNYDFEIITIQGR